MSRVELELSTGHTAIIEVEDEDLIPFLTGKVSEPPSHPDERAQKITDEIGEAMADDDRVHSFGVQVIAVRMVSSREQADAFAAHYRDVAARVREYRLDETDARRRDEDKDLR